VRTQNPEIQNAELLTVKITETYNYTRL